jgi:tetratricopeptide (TPR) repeat protein
MRQALESQRRTEQSFVERAQASEKAPQGWPAALLMFHVGMWRERLRNALTDISEGRDYQRPPADTDELNDAELPKGIGTPLVDAASRSDHLISELIQLYEELGERPMEWNAAKNTTEALLRNSYTHPRLHLFEYYHENGMPELANELWVEAVADMRTAKAPGIVLGTVLYNLACVRAQEGRPDEAIGLLEEAIPLRPDIKEFAAEDSDLGDVRDDARFKDLIQT